MSRSSSASLRPILAAELTGVKATLSRVGNLPSQPKPSSQAAPSMVGERNGSGRRASPIARGNPSPQARRGWWQVAQAMVPEADSMVSKNSCRPSSALSGE